MTTRTPATLLPGPVRFGLLFISLSIATLAQTKAPVPVYSWTTLAGRASIGVEDGPAANARFNNPHGLAMDLTGNMFVADTGNHTIRKITPTGIVSTFAGSTGISGSNDGTGSAARFNGPQGVGVDPAGNVYVADTGNHTIRKITPAGVVTTIAGQAGKKGTADGAASSALFDSPDRLTVDTQGNVYLYNNGVRKISGGQVQTLQIPTTECPAVDASGQLYYTGDDLGGARSVFKIDSLGSANLVHSFQVPYETNYVGPIFNDVSGNIFVTHRTQHPPNALYSIGHQIMPDNTITGTNVSFVTNIGSPTTPFGVAVDQIGHWFYTRDTDDAIIGDNRVAYAGTPLPLHGLDGTGANARLFNAYYLTIDVSGNAWIAENLHEYATSPLGNSTTPINRSGVAQQKITPAGIVSTLSELKSDYLRPSGLASDAAGNLYLAIYDYLFGRHLLRKTSPTGTVTSPGDMPDSYSGLGETTGLIADPSGKLYTQTSKTSSILLPDGSWQFSSWRNPQQILQQLPDGSWSIFAGGSTVEIKDGTGDAARFSYLHGLTIDRQGNLFGLDSLLDNQNNLTGELYIRKISPAGVVTTVSKKLTSDAALLAVDSKGTFYLTHPDLGTITQLNAQWEEVTIGGLAGVDGNADGNGEQARFAGLGSLAVDAQDNLYVIDGFGTTVRKGQYVGIGPVITIQPQNLMAASGTNVQLTVAANGTPAPTYQWFFGSTALSGATGTSLSLPNVRSSDAGDYSIVVTNALGSVTSNKATLTVGSAPAPTPAPTPAQTGSGGGGSVEGWFGLSLLALLAARRWMKNSIPR